MKLLPNPCFGKQRLLSVCAAVWIGTGSAGAATIQDLHRDGEFAKVAELGLERLLREPWNHELRFLVADALERNGDPAAASSQFSALSGTNFAEMAQIRLGRILAVDKVGSGTGIGLTRSTTLLASNIYGERAFEVPTKTISSPVLQENIEKRLAAFRSKAQTTPVTPERERLSQLIADGKYQEVAAEGSHLLATQGRDDELRLIVANSLAWTGQLDRAIPAYAEIIRDGSAPATVNDARVGLGNVLRWQGRDDLAMPQFKQALAEDASLQSAQEGIQYAQRELRPKTSITLGRSSDSSEMERRSLVINHRWRDASLQNIYEIELGGSRDNQAGDKLNQGDVTVRYQALGATLKPKFWASMQGTPSVSGFAGVQLQVIPQKFNLDVEYLNWGQRAVTARALRHDLAATHLGANGKLDVGYGDIRMALDYFDISDNNTIMTTGIRYTPPWRYAGVQAFVGAETREPKVASADYWSPVAGYGSTFAGLQGEWAASRWDLFLGGQVGKRMYGDAGSSWSLSGGGRAWLSQDIALGLRLWKMSSWRDEARYNANLASVTLESLW